ncbi:hypothetical protein MPSEU_000132700 [Mayamaea pseudoterrestris]|nr:hypothetical protein MPSEU_000132700 [Mayamaea pseudoterrestris]
MGDDQKSIDADADKKLTSIGPAKRDDHDGDMASPNKKARTSAETSMPVDVPMKLFATLSDVSERANHAADANHWSQSHCWTLREMLGFDGNRPCHRIDWLVICNYMIDFEYLLDEVPELISIPQVLSFYGVADTPWTAWKAASPRSAFVRLDPSAPPGQENPLTTRIPYGVHHSKIFLVGFADGTLRVIIHTANLRYNDIHLKTQAAYIQDFALKKSNAAAPSRPNDFENGLAMYLQSYKYQTALMATESLAAETLVQRIRRYDYSSAQVILIPSTPGYHSLDSRLGHLELRRNVKAHGAPVDRNARVVCQLSSIGSLTEKYLVELQESMNQSSSSSGQGSNVQMNIVYPTVEEIRTSVQGYHGGGSVPGSIKNVSKPFLQRLYRRWSSQACNPIYKPRNVPHIKSYYQTCPDGASLSWLVLSSHNLSKAAWGDVINTRFGRRLFIRHWELGVFLSPKLLKATRLIPWTAAAVSAMRSRDAIIPLPYNMHPEPYQAADQPWAVDMRYSRPDSFGRLSAHDP